MDNVLSRKVTAATQAAAAALVAQRSNNVDAQTTRDGIGKTADNHDEDDDDDEMPLLFMDRLPSDFASNAQLAAIATLMDGDSDTERAAADRDGNGSDSSSNNNNASYARSSSTSLTRRNARQRTRKQTPYAKSAPAATTAHEQQRRTASDAKELQLYLSMFKM